MKKQLYILSFIFFSLVRPHCTIASVQEPSRLLRKMQLRDHCPLLETIREGNALKLTSMLEGETCEFEPNPFGWDPLMGAVVKHRTDMVTILLESKHAQSFVRGKIRVSESDGASLSGWTAMHFAAQTPNLASASILKYLLSKVVLDLDINAKNAFGETAFDIALNYNRTGPNFQAIEELLRCERFNLLETKLLSNTDPHVAYSYVQRLLGSSHQFCDTARQRLEEETSELRHLVEEQMSETESVRPVQQDKSKLILWAPLPKLPTFR